MFSVLPTPHHQRIYEGSRRWCEAHFDKQAGLVVTQEVHPLHPQAQGFVHPYRESAYYAMLLQLSGQDEDLPLAEGIWHRILPGFLDNPQSPYHGCISYSAEDDWETWESIDINWTPFMGMALASTLAAEHTKPRLSASLRNELSHKLNLIGSHLAGRNIDATYTNMALMTIAGALGAAKFADNSTAGQYATTKLQEIYDGQAGFEVMPEYVSPTYYGVAFSALYSILSLTEEAPKMQEQANALLEIAWNNIEEAWDPVAQQLAGPHSRCYIDDMAQYPCFLKFYLHLATEGGYELPLSGNRHTHDSASGVYAACQAVSPRPQLATRPHGRQVQLAAPQQEHGKPITLTRYWGESFVLGSVDEQNLWSQRRNLLAYFAQESPGTYLRDEMTAPGGAGRDFRFFARQVDNLVVVWIQPPMRLTGMSQARYTIALTNPQPHELLSPQPNTWHWQMKTCSVLLQAATWSETTQAHGDIQTGSMPGKSWVTYRFPPHLPGPVFFLSCWDEFPPELPPGPIMNRETDGYSVSVAGQPELTLHLPHSTFLP